MGLAGQAYLQAGPGTNGMLIAREGRIDSAWPLLGPFDSPPLGIDKFDHWNLGTYNSAIQAGIVPAIQFHQEIGTRKIHARLQELTRYWVNLARDIPGFSLHTPLDTDDLGAVNLFSINGMDSRKVEQELRQTHNVHVRYREVRHINGMRVSPHLYMLKSDLDLFVDALKQVVKNHR